MAKIFFMALTILSYGFICIVSIPFMAIGGLVLSLFSGILCIFYACDYVRLSIYEVALKLRKRWCFSNNKNDGTRVLMFIRNTSKLTSEAYYLAFGKKSVLITFEKEKSESA